MNIKEKSIRNLLILFLFIALIAPFILYAQNASLSVSIDNGNKLVFIPYEMFLKADTSYHNKPAEDYMDTLRIGLKDDGNLAMRIEAASILGRYHSKKSIHLLHKTLATTKHPDLRTQCIDALVRINDEISVMYIENALKDAGEGGTLKDKPFVKSGLESIEEAHKKDPKSTISLPTKESYLQVKRMASWGLGVMAHSRSIIVLAGSLDDPDPDVRINAAFSLGEIANPGAVISKKSSTVEDHIEDIIKKFNDENQPEKVRIALAFPMLKLRKNERKGFYFVAKSLLSDDDFIRAFSARVLGRLHDIRGLSPLEDSIGRERNQWVLSEMDIAIKQIKMFNQSYR